MRRNLSTPLLAIILLFSAAFLIGCLPAEELPLVEPEPTQAAPESPAAAPQLATARVSARISEPGIALVTGHNDQQYEVTEDPADDRSGP